MHFGAIGGHLVRDYHSLCSMRSYARVADHLRRLFGTLGLERKPKDIGPTLGELIRADQAAERSGAQALTPSFSCPRL
jgi:hypothetical protein